MLGPTWNEELELPDWSYSVSTFKIILIILSKITKYFTINPPIQIYVQKFEKIIKFKIK